MFLDLYFLAVNVIQMKIVWANKVPVVNKTQVIKKLKALLISLNSLQPSKERQSRSATASRARLQIYSFCESGPRQGGLVPKHATHSRSWTTVPFLLMLVMKDLHRKTNASPTQKMTASKLRMRRTT